MNTTALCLIFCAAFHLPLAAASSADHLAAGERLRNERKPKEALVEFRSAIDADRFNVMVSAPALVGWVACSQMLHGDQASEAEYAAQAPRYLSKPPALNGKSVLALDAAAEDLLWKSWDDKPLITFSVKDCSRESAIEKGKRKQSLRLSLEMKCPPAMTLQYSDSFEPMTLSMAPGSSRLTAMDTEGKAYPTSQFYFHSFGGHESIWATFDGLGGSVTTLASVEGSISLKQPKSWQTKEVPLRQGETFACDKKIFVLDNVTRSASACSVSFAMSGAEADNGVGAGHGAASAAASSGSGGADGGRSNVWLQDDAGNTYFPNGSSTSSTNGRKECQLSFANAAATKLVCRNIIEMSTREVPIELTDVKLP
jgi:hypothetical protein